MLIKMLMIGKWNFGKSLKKSHECGIAIIFLSQIHMILLLLTIIFNSHQL